VADRAEQDVTRLIQRALEEGPFTIQQLADAAGISYDSLYSWAKGRRAPRPDNLRQLASGFDHQGDVLKKLADELRRAADTRTRE
jgi:transcriptional regulator with XRE-family HTH domain